MRETGREKMLQAVADGKMDKVRGTIGRRGEDKLIRERNTTVSNSLRRLDRWRRTVDEVEKRLR